MATMKLYHVEIGLPTGFRAPTHRVDLAWSRHADHARTTDRYAPEIPKFSTLPLSQFSVVEIGVNHGRVEKLVMRGHWTANYDVVFVLIPSRTAAWFVKTVWVNERNDTHKTLDRSKYVC